MIPRLSTNEEIALLRQEVGRLTILLQRMKLRYYTRGQAMARKRIVLYLRGCEGVPAAVIERIERDDYWKKDAEGDEP